MAGLEISEQVVLDQMNNKPANNAEEFSPFSRAIAEEFVSTHSPDSFATFEQAFNEGPPTKEEWERYCSEAEKPGSQSTVEPHEVDPEPEDAPTVLNWKTSQEAEFFKKGIEALEKLQLYLEELQNGGKLDEQKLFELINSPSYSQLSIGMMSAIDGQLLEHGIFPFLGKFITPEGTVSAPLDEESIKKISDRYGEDIAKLMIFRTLEEHIMPGLIQAPLATGRPEFFKKYLKVHSKVLSEEIIPFYKYIAVQAGLAEEKHAPVADNSTSESQSNE